MKILNLLFIHFSNKVKLLKNLLKTLQNTKQILKMRRNASFEEGLIILSLEGRNLLPPCSFYLSLKTDYKEWESLGRTEQSMTKIHLFFLKFTIPFSFESFQQIRLQMFNDIDGQILAERIILLSRILRTHQQKIDLRFMTNIKLSKANQPILSIKAENKGFRNGELSFYLMGKFANISYFIPSIYFTISELNIEKNRENKPPEKTNKNSDDFINLKNNYKTKSEILSGFELIWPEFNLSIPRIYGEKDLEEKVLKVSFFMKNWIFSDTLLGVVHLNIYDILEETHKNYQILSSQSSKLIGNLLISKVKFQNKPSFLDYIFTGLDVNLLLAVDFPSEAQSFLPYEQIFEGLHEFINEYDSEKKMMLYGYGNRFYEENEMKFEIEGPIEKSGCVISPNSLESLLFSYKELKAKLLELKKFPRGKTEIFTKNSQFKPNLSIKKNFLKIDCLKNEDSHSEEGQNLFKNTREEMYSPMRINRKSSKKHETLKKNHSFYLDESPKTPKIRGSFQRFQIGSIDEMLLEMSEYVQDDMKKPRFSKLKFYLIVILITESIENEELQRAFEISSKLSLEMPIFTKFVIIGNMDIEKFKGNFSLYKEIGRKSRNKGIGIIDKKVINGECERIMKAVAEKGGIANENDINELKKTLIRNSVFKGIPKHIVEFFYAENTIPLMNKKESFSK